MAVPAPTAPLAARVPLLQPGVAGGMHILLQAVLATLNLLLGYCAVVGTLRPHFEVLFALSLALTGCYAWFMAELAKVDMQDAAASPSGKPSRDKNE